MEMKYENLKATELRLGLPGRDDESDQQSLSSVKNKRSSSEMENSCEKTIESDSPAPKAQVMGWPPVRSYQKNILKQKPESDGSGMFVKVSMDGAPFLRKIDLKLCKNYFDLLKALGEMFKCRSIGYSGSEYALTYEDKDEDWMLVGDVPWHMFSNSCKRMRIMKGSEAKGLGCI